MASASDTVRAVRLERHGEPLVVREITLPEPGDGELRVELEFGGINPVDGYIAQGRVSPDGPLPRTLGGEASGTVDGRPVLVTGEGLGARRDGVWAQAAVVPVEAVIPLPAGVSNRDAAAMGIAGLTAYNVVHDLARVTNQDRVLVLGASGGVGSLIVSLAHAVGATVWGQTGAAAKADFIVRQGADRSVVAGPHQIGEPARELEPTVVFDPLGDGFVAPVLEAMPVASRFVSFGTSAGPQVSFNMQTLYRGSISLLGYGGLQLRREQRRPGLEAALRALAAGSIRVSIDAVLPLGEVNVAFERLAERRVRGNLLLDLR
jgi:NADPH2:quinone reductase